MEEPKRRPEERRGGFDDRHGFDNEGQMGEDRRRDDERHRREEAERGLREEAQRKAREEARKIEERHLREAEEEKKLREEQEIKRREVAAKRDEAKSAVAIRRAFMRLHSATLDSFDTVKQELEELMLKEAPLLGSQLDKIQEEHQRVVDLASKRVDALKEERKKQQELKDKADKQRQETDRLVGELTDLVDVAEAKTDLLKEMIEPLKEEDLAMEDVTSLMNSIEEQATEAEAAHVACFEFAQGAKLMPLDQDPKNITFPQVKQQMIKLGARVNESASRAQVLLHEASLVRDAAKRKSIARKAVEDEQGVFDSYDGDGDGAWSQDEVASYAKGEFDLDMAEEDLNRICRAYGNQNGAVPFSNLMMVRCAVGAAREHVRGKARRKVREEREAKEAAEREQRRKIVDEARTALQETMAKINEEVKGLEGDVTELEGKVRPIVSLTAKAAGPGVDELNKLLTEVDSLIKAAETRYSTARESVEALATQTPEAELKDYLTLEIKKFTVRLERCKARVGRSSMATMSGRELVAKRAALELEKLRTVVVSSLRNYMQANKLSGIEALFKEIHQNPGAHMTEAEFVTFVRDKCGSEIPPEKLQAIFGMVATGPDSCGVLEDFIQLLKVYNKVVDQTVMTAGLSVRDSRIIRRMVPKEVLEVYEGPIEDPGSGIMRVRAKALQDGAEGWVTVKGNQGTVYLEEGGNLYKVNKDVNLVRDFDVSPTVVIRRLKDGEVLEVLEWEQERKGAKWIKAKAKSDCSIGWATTVDERGVEHLSAV